MYVVLSRLKGSKGVHYAEMELKKLTNGKSLHWYWELFTTEIEEVFCPQLQQYWACNVLKKLKQTDNMSTVAVAHAPPAMVLFFLFLFVPLTFAFVLTAVAVLCKPGCAVSAADTSSV